MIDRLHWCVTFAFDNSRFLDGEKIMKYKMAASCVSKALQTVCEVIHNEDVSSFLTRFQFAENNENSLLHELCSLGDDTMRIELAKIFNKGQVEKGCYTHI